MYYFILMLMYGVTAWSSILIGVGIILIQLGGLCHDRRLFFFARRFGARCGRGRCSRQQTPQQTPQQAPQVVVESLNHVEPNNAIHESSNLVVPEKPRIQHQPQHQQIAPPMMPASTVTEQQQQMMFPMMLPSGQVQMFMFVPYQTQPPQIQPQHQIQYPLLYPTHINLPNQHQ